MESKPANSTVDFQALQSRLIAEINTRVDNGIYSERALARLTGISQPHLHNILKGARKLSPEVADLLLRQLNVSVVDLLTPHEIAAVSLRKPASSAGRLPFVEDVAG